MHSIQVWFFLNKILFCDDFFPLSDENYQYRGLLTIQNNVPVIKQDSINDEQLKSLQESSKNGDNYYLKAEAYQTLVFEHEKPYQISKTFIPAVSFFLLFSKLKLNLISIWFDK